MRVLNYCYVYIMLYSSMSTESTKITFRICVSSILNLLIPASLTQQKETLHLGLNNTCVVLNGSYVFNITLPNITTLRSLRSGQSTNMPLFEISLYINSISIHSDDCLLKILNNGLWMGKSICFNLSNLLDSQFPFQNNVDTATSRSSIIRNLR